MELRILGAAGRSDLATLRLTIGYEAINEAVGRAFRIGHEISDLLSHDHFGRKVQLTHHRADLVERIGQDGEAVLLVTCRTVTGRAEAAKLDLYFPGSTQTSSYNRTLLQHEPEGEEVDDPSAEADEAVQAVVTRFPDLDDLPRAVAHALRMHESGASAPAYP